MRRLAAACGLNVATIYHYFPSKADLLRALIERRYGERMAAEDPPADPGLAPARSSRPYSAGWRTARSGRRRSSLLGEGLHGNPTARQSARALADTLDPALAAWLADGFPELTVPPAVAAWLVRGALLALVTEHLATGRAGAAAPAHDLAAALFDPRGRAVARADLVDPARGRAGRAAQGLRPTPTYSGLVHPGGGATSGLRHSSTCTTPGSTGSRPSKNLATPAWVRGIHGSSIAVEVDSAASMASGMMSIARCDIAR